MAGTVHPVEVWLFYSEQLIFPNSSHLQRRVAQICADPNFGAPFIDFAIAGLMGLACRYCPPSGGQDLVKDLRRRENLTRILLQLQQDSFPSEELIAALKTDGFDSVFPRATRSVLASVSTQNDWVKDLGRFHLLTSIPDIGHTLAARTSFETVSSWVQNRLGISPEEYQALSHIFLAYAFSDQINQGSMLQDFLAVNADRFDFFRLAITTPDKIVAQPEPRVLEEALFGPLPLWVSPVLHDGNEFYISSRGWLFNKLLRGLPYLILETERLRVGRDLSDDEVTAIRGEFGFVFEAYVCWLFRQWFQKENAEIISPYYVKTVDGRWREKDLLLLHDNVAYPFEIKALVPPLRLRQTGDLNAWLNYLGKIAEQAVDAADAIVSGRAFYENKSSQIKNVHTAYPCGVTFEAIPFRQPFVQPFENALSAKLGHDVFTETNGVGPLQLFEVEALESWDEFFSLPAEASQLFALVRQRSQSIVHRYSGFGRMRSRNLSRPADSLGILEQATARATESVLAKAKELSSQIALPEFLKPFGPQLRTVGGPWERK